MDKVIRLKMKDNEIASFDKELNKFLQPKCLIPGGLGLWETYFRRICTAWGCIDSEIRPQHIIFSADNGCNMEGYVGYNYEVTQKQSRNMVLGNTAATLFCKFNTIPYEVVDVGIASEDGIGVDCKVAKGTKNILHGPAMTSEEFNAAFQAGYERVEYYVAQKINLFSFGEMGLGNTTTSACVLSALTKATPEETVGFGSWPDKPDLMRRKIDFVRQVLDFHQDYLDVSNEIDRVHTIIARATHINPQVEDYALPSHHSRERGMDIALAEVGLTRDMVPIQAQMAMGEGTGAILMVQMLRTTHHMFVNVGTFADIMKL